MAVILKVNGEAVPGELIEAERVRLSALDGWETIQDPAERENMLQDAAEKSAVDSGNTPDSFTGNLGFRVARDVYRTAPTDAW